MATWKLAPALGQLRKQINAAWPKRDKSLDGTIGDAAHAARKSEHNPNRDPKDDVPDGYVTAMDIDKDGIPANEIVKMLIADSRVWYVIHKGTIWSRTYGFKARKYTGANAHNGHIHVSLVQSKAACNSTKAFKLPGVAVPKPVQDLGEKVSKLPEDKPKAQKEIPFPGVKNFRVNEKSNWVTVLDEWLILLGYTKHKAGVKYTAGPTFTSYTKANVRDFQRAQGWTGVGADGIPGPLTWERMQFLARRKGWKQ
jgi:hypothetical protein